VSIIDNTKKVIKTFKKYKIDYMFIGRGAAIIQGFSEMTKDIDVYVDDEDDNKKNLLEALKEIGFKLDIKKSQEVLDGKDFISFLSPFELDIIFYPDGFENYKDGSKYKKLIDGIPVMSITGIIKSKKLANRAKDKSSLPQLMSFEKYLKKRN
jgi:hypothetical protein